MNQSGDYFDSIDEHHEGEELAGSKPKVSKPSHFAPAEAAQKYKTYLRGLQKKKFAPFQDEECPMESVIPCPSD